MTRYIFILILSTLSIGLSAQSYLYKGIVKEVLENKPVNQATVKLLSYPEENYISETTTTQDGTFEIQIPDAQLYFIEVTHPFGLNKIIKIIHTGNRKDIEAQEYKIVLLNKPDSEKIKGKKNKQLMLIKGVVKEKSTHTPLNNITVRIVDANSKLTLKTYKTDENGSFIFYMKPDNYLLRINSKQYTPQVSKWIITEKRITTVNVPTIYLERISEKTTNTPLTDSTKTVNEQTVHENSKLQDENIIEDLKDVISEPSVEHVSEVNSNIINKILTGVILDNQTNEPIGFTPISVLSSTNQFIKSTESDELGKFTLHLKNGAYILKVKMLGYKDLLQDINLSEQNNSTPLTLKMETDAILLSEATVTAKVPNIRVKGDTIEYWAGAYAKEKDILLQDILKNIPGAKITSEGILTINNKPVNKILINGKEFFGNDIQMALRNIPSEIINTLKVYNEQSEMAELMGVDDTDDNQVLDLGLKDEYKNSIFGNAQLGFGSDDKYYHKFMVNRLSNSNNLTILGNMNNINNDDSGLGTDSDGPGLNSNKTIGINYNTEQIQNLKIEGNASFEDITESAKNTQRSEQTISTGNRFTESEGESKETTKTSKVEARLEWKPKSNISLHYRISGTHTDTKTEERSNMKSYTNKQDTTTETSNSILKGRKNEISNMFSLGWKLNEKGRNLAFQLNGSIEKGEENGINKEQTSYLNLKEKNLDQKIHNTSSDYSWGGSISYTEPLNEYNTLYATYSFSNSKSNSGKNVFNADEQNIYSIVDEDYTRAYKDLDWNQNIGVGFQSKKEKYDYSINLNLEPVSNKSKISLGDSLIQDLKQKTNNYRGSFKFSYKPKKTQTFNVTYSGMVSTPNTTQLSTDTTTVDNMNKSIGNSGLRGSFTNMLNLQYQQSDFDTGRFFITSLGLNTTTNQIANYSIIDNGGNTINSYKNVNGNWSSNLSFIFSSPLKNDKFTLDNSITGTYNRSVGFVNDLKNIMNSYNLHENLSLNFDSDIVQSNLQIEGDINISKNNLSNLSNKKLYSYGIVNSTSIDLPFDISLQNSLSYKYYIGYSSQISKDELLWSIAFSKNLLNEKGLLRFYIYDILNQKNNVSRIQKNNQITDMTINSVRRYFMLSFLYRFNINNK